MIPRRVAIVRTGISEQHISSIIRVTRIAELGRKLAVTISVLQLLGAANIISSSSILVNLMMEAILSSETSVLIKPHRVASQKTELSIATTVNT
jgi:hypothetical protein